MEPNPEVVDQLVGKTILSNRGVASPYLIETWIAGGGFGQIFLGINRNTKGKVAIKLERKDAPRRQLYLEFGFYFRLGRDCDYVPRVHFFGCVANWNALVIDLLGPSLLKLLRMLGNFSTACTAAVAIKLLKIFQDFHDNGLLCRDVKPDNFLVGATDTENAYKIYLIDLGMAKEWQTPEGEHITYVAGGKTIGGTLLYLSLNMHSGAELSRRDDLESLLYNLIHLQTGALPWMAADKGCHDQLELLAKYGEMKRNLSANEICAKMPAHFKQVFKQVRNLTFEERPDYDGYRKSFAKILTDCNNSSNINNLEEQINRAFDWDRSHKRRPNRRSRQASNASGNRSLGRSHSSDRLSKTSQTKIPKKDGK